ncbi:MAG: OmpH family outer membrane protein [Desulfatitalea sp.]
MRLRKIVMMMSFGLCLLTIGIPFGFCADVAKIGTVNFQKIFENSSAGKAVKTAINSEGQRMEQDLKQKGEEIKALEKRLGEDAGVMSKEAREEQRWEYERKIDEVKALKKKYDRQIQELQMQRVNAVRQEVLQLIQEYGKKEGYLLIIEDVNVVYAPQNLDLTDEIIKRYNEKPSKAGGKSQGSKE